MHIHQVVAAVAGPDTLDNALSKHGATAEPVREKATCFLVPDVADPGQRVLLNVGLCGGGVVLSLQALATGKGPMVAYERASAVRRKVWFSEAFQATHPGLLHTFLVRLADATAGPVRWGIISQRDEFIRQLRKNRRGGLAFVALVAKTEVDDQDLRGAKRFTASETAGFVVVLRKHRQRCGANFAVHGDGDVG